MSFMTRGLGSAQQKLQDSADQKRQSNNSSALQRRRDLLNLKINFVVRDREEESPFNPNNRSMKSIRSRESNDKDKSCD